MLGIGGGELLIIMLVALVVLGPDHLPKIMRTVGKGLAEFRKVSTEIQRTLNTEIAFEEEREKKAAEKKKAAAAKKNEAATAETVTAVKEEA